MVIIHPQGDLAVFGFTPTMKVEFYEILLYLGYLLEQCMYRDIVLLIFLIQNLEFFGKGTFDQKKSPNRLFV
jgi:hypothetical protein